VDRVTELFGEDYGGYTLTVAQLNEGDIQTIESQLRNATVTPTMVAKYEKTDGSYSTLLTDLEGDGVFETEVQLDGTPILPPPTEVSYDSLRTLVKALMLNKSREKVLLSLIHSAETLSKKKSKIANKLEVAALKLAEKTVQQYQRKQHITAEQADAIIKMITQLRLK